MLFGGIVLGLMLIVPVAYKLGRQAMFAELEAALGAGQHVQVGQVLVTDTIIVKQPMVTVCDICHAGGF